MASGSLKKLTKRLDNRLWRVVFGTADYMQLRPSFRMRLKIALRFPISLSGKPIEDPVFIVGCPRSGTTVLFNILSLALPSFRQEGHWVWELFHPPSKKSSYTQTLEAGDLTSISRSFIHACYKAAFGGQRFVDKNPTNTLRIPAIKSVFPNAKFVCLIRNGPDNVSSLIDAWRHPTRFPGFNVPDELMIEGYGRDKWVMMLEPGWQNYTKKSIQEVCAHQWLTTNEILLKTKGEITPEDWVEVRYEDLLRTPNETVQKLLNSLGLNMSLAISEFVNSLEDHVINTDTKPELGKWKSRNFERVQSVMPLLRPMMDQLGYNGSE
jgi:hypothetical protein